MIKAFDQPKYYRNENNQPVYQPDIIRIKQNKLMLLSYPLCRVGLLEAIVENLKSATSPKDCLHELYLDSNGLSDEQVTRILVAWQQQRETLKSHIKVFRCTQNKIGAGSIGQLNHIISFDGSSPLRELCLGSIKL